MNDEHQRRAVRDWAGATPDLRAELDRRLGAYAADGNRGRLAADVIADIRRKLRRA